MHRSVGDNQIELSHPPKGKLQGGTSQSLHYSAQLLVKTKVVKSKVMKRNSCSYYGPSVDFPLVGVR